MTKNVWHMLDQYTIDEAHKIVVSYVYLDAEQRYHAALKELEDRYGNTEYIASAFIKGTGLAHN